MLSRASHPNCDASHSAPAVDLLNAASCSLRETGGCERRATPSDVGEPGRLVKKRHRERPALAERLERRPDRSWTGHARQRAEALTKRLERQADRSRQGTARCTDVPRLRATPPNARGGSRRTELCFFPLAGISAGAAMGKAENRKLKAETAPPFSFQLFALCFPRAEQEAARSTFIDQNETLLISRALRAAARPIAAPGRSRGRWRRPTKHWTSWGSKQTS